MQAFGKFPMDPDSCCCGGTEISFHWTYKTIVPADEKSFLVQKNSFDYIAE